MTASMTDQPHLRVLTPFWQLCHEGAENGRGAYSVEQSKTIAGIEGKVVGYHRGWWELWFTPEQCRELYDLLTPEDES